MYSFINWFSQYWLEATQTGGILAGLIFTSISLRGTQKAQNITNLYTLTQYQRELYGTLFDRPELRRIFHKDINLSAHPVTDDERLFLILVILHLNLAIATIRLNAIVPIEGLERDLEEMFTKPIPQAVWKEIRAVQNCEVRELIDRLTSKADE